MIYVLLVILLALIGTALWRMGKRSRDTDEDLKYMNEGTANGPGIWGIMRKDRR